MLSKSLRYKLRFLVLDGKHIQLRKAIGKLKKKSSASSFESLLFDAILSSHVDCVRVLFETFPDMNSNAASKVYGTPLHLCARLRSLDEAYEICKLLIDRGADIAAQGRLKKRTPLHNACEHNNSHVALIDLLVNERTIRMKNSDDELPHTVAATEGHVRALQVLFDFEERNRMPLGDKELIELANSTMHFQSKNSEEVLALIFERHRDAIVRSELVNPYLLCSFIQVGLLQFAEILLEQGVSPVAVADNNGDLRESTALEMSISVCSDDEAFRLVAKYITPEIMEDPSNTQLFRNTFHMAIKYSKFKEFQTMINMGVDFGSYENELTSFRFDQSRFSESVLYSKLIHYSRAKMLSHVLLAVCDDQATEDLVKSLLDRGAAVNAECDDEMPPLVALALRIYDGANEFNSHCDSAQSMFSRLLERGADPFYRSSPRLVSSPFYDAKPISVASPDLALVASLIGDIPFLFHVMSCVGFNVIALLRDIRSCLMTNGVIREMKQANTRRRTLRKRLVSLTRVCLLLTANSGDVISIAEDLNSLTFARYDGETSRQVFDQVQEHLENVLPLQHMCRAVICRRLTENATTLERNTSENTTAMERSTCESTDRPERNTSENSSTQDESTCESTVATGNATTLMKISPENTTGEEGNPSKGIVHVLLERKIDQLNIPSLLKQYLKYQDMTWQQLETEFKLNDLFRAESVFQISSDMYEKSKGCHLRNEGLNDANGDVFWTDESDSDDEIRLY